jgi:membrane associated rhomboid family serine protease
MFDRRNWTIWPVVAICVIVFVAQKLSPDMLVGGSFSPQAVREGRWWTLFTAMFLHSGFAHIAMNMWSYLVLSPLVAARFGRGWRGLVPFLAFYLLCGLAGNVLFWAMHPHSDIPVVGASGAIYGVYAAMMRLDLFQERLKPVWSRTTLDAAWFFIWSNAIVIAVFGGPMMLLQLIRGDPLAIPVAWEAHLGGFVAGYVLIGLMAGKGWKDDWRAGLVLMRQPQF